MSEDALNALTKLKASLSESLQTDTPLDTASMQATMKSAVDVLDKVIKILQQQRQVLNLDAENARCTSRIEPPDNDFRDPHRIFGL